MIIEYREGKKIITHPSGHVDIYDITHIEKFKTHVLDEGGRIQNIITAIDADLEQMRLSAGISDE